MCQIELIYLGPTECEGLRACVRDIGNNTVCGCVSLCFIADLPVNHWVIITQWQLWFGLQQLLHVMVLGAVMDS